MSASPSPATQTQTTSTQLTPEQQQLIGLGLPDLTQYNANPTSVSTDPNQLVAGFTAPQLAGQSQVLGATGGQGSVVQGGEKASNFLTSGAALSPTTNPAEAAQIAAAVQPIQTNLTTSTIPQISTNATNVGQTGSSRAGVAEGLASLGASEAEGQTAANVANTSYNTGMNAMVQALGLVPSTAGAMTIPGATTSAVGDVQQQQQQQVLDAALMASIYNSQQPLATGEALTGVAAGLPGATVTANGTSTAAAPSTFQQILGYGSLGASLLGGAGSAMKGFAALGA